MPVSTVDKQDTMPETVHRDKDRTLNPILLTSIKMIHLTPPPKDKVSDLWSQINTMTADERDQLIKELGEEEDFPTA